jgi:hypothetical protein
MLFSTSFFTLLSFRSDVLQRIRSLLYACRGSRAVLGASGLIPLASQAIRGHLKIAVELGTGGTLSEVHKEGRGFPRELYRGLERLKISDMFQSATDGGRDSTVSDISTAGGVCRVIWLV